MPLRGTGDPRFYDEKQIEAYEERQYLDTVEGFDPEFIARRKKAEVSKRVDEALAEIQRKSAERERHARSGH